MRTRVTAPALALATTAVLALSACSSSGGGSSDRVKTADDAGASRTPSASPTVKPTTASGASRPKITLPKGFTADFEHWSDPDPAKNAVLEDAKQQLLANHSAILHGADPESTSVAFYNIGQALKDEKKWIGQYRKNGLTITGKVRYGNARVRTLAGKNAAVTYCADENHAYDAELSTGKVDKSEVVGSKNFILYSLNMTKSSDGVWQTSILKTERGACRL